MKTLKKLLVLALFMMIGCSRDDDGNRQATLDIVDFKIVNSDGSDVRPTDCIDPNTQYAVAIQTRLRGEGEIQVKRVEFTLNGTPYSVTLNSSGISLTNIPINTGVNTIQLVESGLTDSVTLIPEPEFELVP